MEYEGLGREKLKVKVWEVAGERRKKRVRNWRWEE